MRQAGLRVLFLICLVAGWASARAADGSAAMSAGERLFNDPRFAYQGSGISCASCHHRDTARLFDDPAVVSAIPERSDGRTTTPRNAPPLVDVLATEAPPGWGLLHWDGEFAGIEDLVAGTFTGRNFGWLPQEKAAAVRHFAQVVRKDVGGEGQLPYATLLQDIDVAKATDGEILSVCARLVADYLRSLQFARDAAGLHHGSPYDAFLESNRLPRAPRPGEAPARYARRLHELVAALTTPKFVDDPARRQRLHGQPFRFGERELEGLRIFLRGSIGYVRTASAGNCAECHVPPDFTDRALHNTGAAQDAYDAAHGQGAFVQLTVPSLAERNADYDRWLQPTASHPQARGVFMTSPSRDAPGRADLGLWNVYGNPDLPAPQAAIESKLNPGGRLSPDEALALTLARFKTPGLRSLGQSGPYLHHGRPQTIEEVLQFYQRMSDLAHSDEMRNAPPEYAAMRLEDADLVPLAAFLRALNEDCAPVIQPAKHARGR